MGVNAQHVWNKASNAVEGRVTGPRGDEDTIQGKLSISTNAQQSLNASQREHACGSDASLDRR